MALKSTVKQRPERVSITMKTRAALPPNRAYRWWETKDEKERAQQLITTAAFLKTGQQSRQKQAAIFARLYGGQSVMNYIGTSMARVDPVTPIMPNRPTYNLIASVCDTLVSRLTQSKPSPVFLTDNGDYKSRLLAKKLTSFTLGEFYQARAYERGAECLLDALVEGTGILKVFATHDKKVGIERVLCTELYVDLEEAAFGNPRRIYQLKLYDREVLGTMFPDKKAMVDGAMKASLDSSSDSKSVSDLVLVVEGWSLPSGEDAGDGYHSISCSAGELHGEEWKKDRFPFVFMHHHKRMLGFWSQGVPEALMGTQLELNSLLDTISKAIRLVGVPRVFYEEGSKVNKAGFSNKIGVMIPYKGNPPIVSVSQCVPQEMYAERDRIIQYGYQQEGISFMGATSQKPQGLDSGEAIRSYDDITSDRFASLERRYSNMYVDLAYLVIDTAIEIEETERKVNKNFRYKTIFPDKKGTQSLDLPDLKRFKDPFVVQCFNESSLPRDPAGRRATIAEHVQSGMLTIQEGRRLMSFPDLEQVDTLASAAEERIFCYLDKIVEDGEYTSPDPFMDLKLAAQLAVQYYNLYVCRGLEEERAELLRNFYDACNLLTQEGALASQPQSPMPTAAPEPTPTSPLVNNTAGQQVAA